MAQRGFSADAARQKMDPTQLRKFASAFRHFHTCTSVLSEKQVRSLDEVRTST